ncbi:MAG: hypothetical protein JWO03_902 [Bacteroidetes bacterium]|nr:hypothetical protein [Bacteroidota bacterium]
MRIPKDIEMGKPSREATEEALAELSKYLSPDKVLRSIDHPELTARGQREISEVKLPFPPDEDSVYNNDRHDRDYEDID